MSERLQQQLEKLLHGLGNVLIQMADLSRTAQRSGVRPEAPEGGGADEKGIIVERRISIRTLDGEEVGPSFFGIEPAAGGEAARTRTRQGAPELRQATIELMEQDGLLTALVELPGAEAETLSIELDGDMLSVRGHGHTVEYRAETILPAAVQPDSRQISFRNGVLEITWRCPAASPGRP